MEHAPLPPPESRKASLLDYALGISVVAIALASALMSLVMRAHGL